MADMQERISRRELGRRGMLGVAAIALPAGVLGQEPEKPKVDPKMPDKVAAIEAKLAKPLSDKVKELLKGSIVASEGAMVERLKHALPENSEPCFLYRVSPKRGKGR